MYERYVGQLLPEMDVCDINGDKVGTIAHVYRHELAAMAASGAYTGPSPNEEIFEVKTGFFGLGKHFYIPLSAIQEIEGGKVYLSKSHDDLAACGWDHRPPYFDELA